MTEPTGFDRESACRTITQSMHILEKCIRETEAFLEHFLRDEKEKIAENWDEVTELTAELKDLVHSEPKSVFREQYYKVNRLVSLIEKQSALLSGNPMEMVKMANSLASLNSKTIGMQLQIDKVYGSLKEGHGRDVLEELSADQIATVFRWVEENREMIRMLGE